MHDHYTPPVPAPHTPEPGTPEYDAWCRSWVPRHTDAFHPGSRDTCDHCQLMISYYGPMPPADDVIAAGYAIAHERGGKTRIAISEGTRWTVWERDDFRCRHCGARRFLAVDHIIPVSKGGTNSLDNYQTLCRRCNSAKKDRPDKGATR